MGMNVYEDLGFDDPNTMQAKAHVTMALQQVIEARGWSVHQAAKHLKGITAEQLATILKGNFRDQSLAELQRLHVLAQD